MSDIVIDNHYIALKLVEALYNKGLINMGHEILKTLWTDHKDAIDEACDIIRKCYALETKQADDAAEAKRKLAKLQQKMANLCEMRLEGDIDQQSFHEKLKIYMDEENAIRGEIEAAGKMQKSKDVEKEVIDYDKIRNTLQEMLDFDKEDETGILDHEIVAAFVKRVIVLGNGEFAWFINLSGKSDTEISAVLDGRKKKATLALYDSDKKALAPALKGDKEKEDFFA